MYLPLNLSEIVIELVTSSLPQSKNNDKNIKKVISEDVDLDFLFYCYTSILNKSENEFWESTPGICFHRWIYTIN